MVKCTIPAEFFDGLLSLLSEEKRAQYHQDTELIQKAAKEKKLEFKLSNTRMLELLPFIWKQRAANEELDSSSSWIKIEGEILIKDKSFFIPDGDKKIRLKEKNGIKNPSCQLDASRLEYLKSLKPSTVFYGTKKFAYQQYYLFQFEGGNGLLTIAECPWTSNGAYVHFSTDKNAWRNVFINKTKSQAKANGAKVMKHCESFQKRISDLLRKAGASV